MPNNEPIIYVAVAADGSKVKIGSTVDLDRRLAELRCRFPDIKVRRTLPGGRKWEKQIHLALAPWALGGEVYRAAPEVMELLDLPETDVREWVLAKKSATADQAARAGSGEAWRGTRQAGISTGAPPAPYPVRNTRPSRGRRGCAW